jgi:hypothetical protein
LLQLLPFIKNFPLINALNLSSAVAKSVNFLQKQFTLNEEKKVSVSLTGALLQFSFHIHFALLTGKLTGFNLGLVLMVTAPELITAFKPEVTKVYADVD